MTASQSNLCRQVTRLIQNNAAKVWTVEQSVKRTGSRHLQWNTQNTTNSRVSNSYDQPQLPPTKMATAENGETKQSRISGKPDRALCPYDTDMSVSYHTMYFSYDHVF